MTANKDKRYRHVIQLRYHLTPAQDQAIVDYLSGKMASRELGKALNLSHAGALNLLPKWMRDAVSDGKLIIQLTKKP